MRSRLVAATCGSSRRRPDRRYGGDRPASHDPGGQARPSPFDPRCGGGHGIAIAARFAAARNLPFAAFRGRRSGRTACASGGACRHRPDWRRGCPAPSARYARAPGQIPHLVKTAFDANAAFVSLFRGRQMTSVGGFGFFDFGELVLDVPREDVIGRSLPV